VELWPGFSPQQGALPTSSEAVLQQPSRKNPVVHREGFSRSEMSGIALILDLTRA
jgi:hypothetical protein